MQSNYIVFIFLLLCGRIKNNEYFTPDVSHSRNALVSHDQVSINPSKDRRIPNSQPPLWTLMSHCSYDYHAIKIAKEWKRKKEMCDSYLSQVTVLLAGVMRHRRRIARPWGRISRGRERKWERERREHSWEARKRWQDGRKRAERTHIQSTQYHQ